MKNEILKIKKIAIPILKEAGIKRSAIFGSCARGEATKSSDVDFLIEFKKEEHAGLFATVVLKRRLEKALGRDVDLVHYGNIHPILKKYIKKDQVKIL